MVRFKALNISLAYFLMGDAFQIKQSIFINLLRSNQKNVQGRKAENYYKSLHKLCKNNEMEAKEF